MQSGAPHVAHAVVVRDLTVSYRDNGTAIVSNFDIGIPVGGRLAIMGPSGVGKSTLASVLAGWPTPHVLVSGAITRRGRIGYVAQDSFSALNPLASVGSQLAMIARASGRSRSDAARHAAHLAQDFSLAPEVLDRRPLELSGGQRQRAAIALALAADPALLVVDEITSALDPIRIRHIVALLDHYLSAHDCGLICVTHDSFVANHLCQNVLTLGIEHTCLAPARPWAVYGDVLPDHPDQPESGHVHPLSEGVSNR